ncbi:MAG: hypothetical protein ACI8Y4_004984 [Candidatus Poriferisodalaceae bacterium]
MITSGIAPTERDESGMTVIELSISMLLLIVLMGSFFTVFSGVLGDSARADQRAGLERELRPVFNRMVIELRQSVAPDSAAAGAPVETLTAASLVFYSDRIDIDGPERYAYELISCVSSVCDLRRSITYAMAGTGPNWTYPVAASQEVTVLTGVDNTNPLFVGRLVNDGTDITLAACDPGGTRCALSGVQIELQLAAARSDTASSLSIAEEVRLRNAIL